MKIYTLAIVPLFLMSATSTQAPTPTPAQYAEIDRKLTNEVVDNTVKTIKHIETKGDTKCTKRGASGEIGCFQFLPATYKNLSKKHFGQVKGFSLEVEQQLVKLEVIDLIEKKKLTPDKVFLYWNSGQYKRCSKGINKHNVPYDSCRYVADAMKYFRGL